MTSAALFSYLAILYPHCDLANINTQWYIFIEDYFMADTTVGVEDIE